ncbi:hypothetical protein [Candidatus Enterovibrio escicola]|uniref:hypothetical protein n=1 Tax=Candidatus Enterovibrio escicola TaxID=1927127 RepID=UPI001681A745|nr:hypothetical protein [Candidatus Enterovibrio escacola]
MEIEGISRVTLKKQRAKKGVSFTTNTQKHMKPKVMQFWDHLIIKKTIYHRISL